VSLVGISQINIELSSRCDKHTLCFMCGHQNEKLNASLKYGDMDFALLQRIRAQIEPPVIVSFHRDGDPLVYPRLAAALALFRDFPTSVVTHGEALARRAAEIIGNCTIVTVSVIPNDEDRDIQLASVAQFLRLKGEAPPRVQLKFVGAVKDSERYEALGVPIINRALHSAKGNWNYVRMKPSVPEIGTCLDFLSRPTVDWRGRMFICNRLDVEDAGLLGDLNTHTLEELWNGPERKRMLAAHLAGRREDANALCARCESYGIPTPSGY